MNNIWNDANVLPGNLTVVIIEQPSRYPFLANFKVEEPKSTITTTHGAIAIELSSRPNTSNVMLLGSVPRYIFRPPLKFSQSLIE